MPSSAVVLVTAAQAVSMCVAACARVITIGIQCVEVYPLALRHTICQREINYYMPSISRMSYSVKLLAYLNLLLPTL